MLSIPLISFFVLIVAGLWLQDRTHRQIAEDEIVRIARTYHAWRGAKHAGEYEDNAEFCKSATTDDIGAYGFLLMPGRIVGAETVEDDDDPFEDKMRRLTATLGEQFGESAKLEKAIRKNLTVLGFATEANE